MDANAKITIPKFEAPPFEGYELALHRAANIVLGMAENLMSRVLHVYCGGNLVDHFGNISTLSVEGLSDREKDVEDAKGRKQYFKSELIDLERDGLSHIGGDVHEYVVCMLPPDRPKLTVSLDELIRITNYKSFVILGLPEKIWAEEGVLRDYERLMKQEQCIMYSLQKFEVDGPVGGGEGKLKYMLTLLRKESNKERMREMRGL